MVQNGFTFWGVLEAIKEWLKLYVVQMHNAYDVFFPFSCPYGTLVLVSVNLVAL